MEDITDMDLIISEIRQRELNEQSKYEPLYLELPVPEYDIEEEKDEKEVNELIDDFLKMIKDNPELKSKLISDDDKTKLMSLSGVKKYPMRVKCATLPWHTTKSIHDKKHLN